MADPTPAPVDALIEKMKGSLSEDDLKLITKLKEDAAALAAAADSDGDGKPDAAGLKALFLKNGEFSKTSAILVMAWMAGLVMWVVQGLFHGATVPGLNAVIPAFDSSAALAMLGAASSLYMATHNIKINVGGSPASDAEKAGG